MSTPSPTSKQAWWKRKTPSPISRSPSPPPPPPPPPPPNEPGIFLGNVSKSAPSCQPPIQNQVSKSKIRQIERQTLERAKMLADKQKDQYKRDTHNISTKDQWLLKIIPNWTRYQNTKLVKKLCSKGIPSAARPQAWPLLMGNNLQITPELMEIFYNHAVDFEKQDNIKRNAIETEARARSARNAKRRASIEQGESSGESTDNNATSKNESDSAAVTTTLQKEDDADSIRLGKRKSLHYIEVDLPRTFPKLSFFKQGSLMHDDLKKLLMSYAFYRPDIGYIQGMSYIAAILLLYMDVHVAFSCFANLLSTHFYFDFFRLDPDKINGHLMVYDCLFQESLPKLFIHFKSEEVISEMYMIDWLLTLYSRSMPIDIAARVWDLYLSEGEMSLFRVAISILKMHRDMLMRLDMAGILSFLHNIPEDMNEHILFDTFVSKIDFSKKHFDRIHKKVQEKKRKDAAGK